MIRFLIIVLLLPFFIGCNQSVKNNKVVQKQKITNHSQFAKPVEKGTEILGHDYSLLDEKLLALDNKLDKITAEDLNKELLTYQNQWQASDSILGDISLLMLVSKYITFARGLELDQIENFTSLNFPVSLLVIEGDEVPFESTDKLLKRFKLEQRDVVKEYFQIRGLEESVTILKHNSEDDITSQLYQGIGEIVQKYDFFIFKYPEFSKWLNLDATSEMWMKNLLYGNDYYPIETSVEGTEEFAVLPKIMDVYKALSSDETYPKTRKKITPYFEKLKEENSILTDEINEIRSGLTKSKHENNQK